MIVDLHLPRLIAQLRAECLEVLQIFLAQPLRIDEQLVAATSRLRNCVHFLKGNSISSGARMWNSRTSWRWWRKCRRALHQRADLVEAVRQDDDQAAARELPGQLVPERGQAGLAAGLRLFQALGGRAAGAWSWPSAGSCWRTLVSCVDQADGVALVQHQVRQRGGDVLGVLELARVLALVGHAAAGIDEQMGLQVGLFLVFLDVVAIGLAEGAPVDVADLVAGIILAMLGELDAEALVGALVDAGEEALDERCARPGRAGRTCDSEVGSKWIVDGDMVIRPVVDCREG